MSNPTPTIGRLTVFVLCLVVFTCVVMIGGAGYVKYELDVALSTIVASSDAATHLAAQNNMQFWAMVLTVLCWCSLIIAAVCAAGIYLALRDKHSAPMRALAQSIENMARGDMNAPIWGLERRDMIGELARAVDIARYHFSHLPDLSLLSEQGPVRMRFEGGSRSLFEAMMQAITRDGENIRMLSSNLSGAVTQQQQAIAALSAQVEDILHTIVRRGQSGDAFIKQAIGEMVGSTESLKNAHAHALDQLNRMIPAIQERAQGLSEITQITGRQITHTLQALSVSEAGLRANAEQARETLTKMSHTADDLGERLFGAINLLQASGKILADTTEDIKNRLGDGVAASPSVISLEPLTQRLDQIAQQISEQISFHMSEMETKIEHKSVAPQPEPAPVAPVIDSAVTDALAELQNRIGALASDLPTHIRNALQEGGDAIVPFVSDNADRAAVPPEWQQHRDEMTQKLTAFEEMLIATRRDIQESRAELGKPAPQANIAIEIQKQLTDQWVQISAQIEASRSSLVEAIADQIDKMENRIALKSPPSLSRTAADYNTQRQIEQQTQILSELVATLGVLDTHMQQIKSDMRAAGG